MRHYTIRGALFMDVSVELEDELVVSETENNEALTLWRPWLQPSSSPPVEKRLLGARYAAPKETLRSAWERSYFWGQFKRVDTAMFLGVMMTFWTYFRSLVLNWWITGLTHKPCLGWWVVFVFLSSTKIYTLCFDVVKHRHIDGDEEPLL